MRVADGRYTGLIDFYAYGPAKAAAIEDLAHRRGYDLSASYAYSDSITDEPMLAVVGHAAVVNPDRALRRLADERGWQALRFVRPVSLRTFGTKRSRGALPTAVQEMIVEARPGVTSVWPPSTSIPSSEAAW